MSVLLDDDGRTAVLLLDEPARSLDPLAAADLPKPCPDFAIDMAELIASFVPCWSIACAAEPVSLPACDCII